MIIVARLAAPEAAEQLCRELSARGIDATVDARMPSQHSPNRVRSSGWAVDVDAGQFPEAMAVLRDLDLLHLSPWEAIPCPACGSLKTEVTKTYYHDISLSMLFLSLFLFGLPLLLRRPRLHCFDCGHLWPKPRASH